MKNDKKYPIHYFWDIGSGHKDTRTVYAVEYKGKAGTISFEEEEKATDKARRVAFELTGDRLYNGKRKNHFEINAPTHDTPMGSYYYFTPISEKTYNKFKE